MKLHALVGTQSEFDHSEKGDALYAFELALCAPACSAVPGPKAALGRVVIPVLTCRLRGREGRDDAFSLWRGWCCPGGSGRACVHWSLGEAQLYQLRKTHF